MRFLRGVAQRGRAARAGRLACARYKQADGPAAPPPGAAHSDPAPACAQELPVGQGEADYRIWLDANPGRRGQILSFEAWEAAAGVKDVLPTWQVIRTASMWRECNGEPFEVPPIALWPGLTRTLAFIRDHVTGAVGPVEAGVSGYRNPALNACAHGAPGSAHQGYSALDLVPLQPMTRPGGNCSSACARCTRATARPPRPASASTPSPASNIDTKSFRRWGSAGPAGNESPCAVLERAATPKPRRCRRW